MENLIQTGLLGRGLIHITNKELVKRYNACLADIGLPTTKLKSFHIDGWGWSPEVADEQQNKFYLSHFGASNPYAIILTPLQEDRPIYFQYHSFDRDLMRIVFRTYKSQIADLTTETAIWINIDQEVTKYDKPQDLLMVDTIKLRFKSVNGVMSAARNQRQLVRMFYDDKYAWSDPELHSLIIESCKKYGDLRFRSLEISNIPYTHVRSFYTKAFNSVFVFRDLPGKKPMLVFTNDKTDFSGDEIYDHIEFTITDKKFVDKLYSELLIKVDLVYFRDHIEELKRLQLSILVDEICKKDQKIDLTALLDIKQQLVIKLLNKYKVSKLYYDLEKLIKNLDAGKSVLKVDTELRLLLSRPFPALEKMTELTVNQLLVNLVPNDIYRLFEFDKELFYKLYTDWPENKKAWALNYIQQVYKPYYSDELNLKL